MKVKASSLSCLAMAIVTSACGNEKSIQGSSVSEQKQASSADLEAGRPAVIETAAKAYDNLDFDFEDYTESQFGVWSGTDESRYQQYKAGYESLWKSLTIRSERMATVDWYVNEVNKHKSRYQKIEKQTGVPWFWVGITHGLEGGFDFTRHLHNGDRLTARTVQVPAGRPKIGKAPFTWEFSASDAISMKAYDVTTRVQLVCRLAQ